MKNFYKFLGIITIVAVIGFSVIGCSTEDDGGGNNSGGNDSGGNNSGGNDSGGNNSGGNTSTTYRITFDATGGKKIDWIQEVKAGQSFTLPYTQRDNYFLNGWYTSASSGTKAGDAGASYTPTGNMTLYAQWKTATKPGTPTGLKLTANTDHSITLTWDAVDGAVYYEIEYRRNVDGIQTDQHYAGSVGHVPSEGSEGPAPTTFTHKGLTPNMMHYYYVRAQNIAGLWSDWSSVRSGMTL